MTRISNSVRNIKVSLIGQISNLIISFIARTIFVYFLSAEYLGLNGLFTNILSILSLAELGIGSAIVYSLYEPLAKKEEYRISALMQIYKKAYISIGIWMGLAGFILTPFLGFFIKEIPEIENINLIYLLFVGNSALTYFFSYKRALIIADQKKYIDSLYYHTSFFVLNIIQIIILVLTQNYIYFLTIKIIITFIENYLISKKADRLYPFLKQPVSFKLSIEEKNTIVRNIKAMFIHRIGNVIVMGTDNLLLSKFVGLVAVGKYSNYLLIINSLNTFFDIIFKSLTASIGNLGATENKERVQQIFKSINFLNFWMYSFASIALINLINPFIIIWVGNEYVFSYDVVFLIVLNFYIQGLRASVLTFRNALGLFWYDRYKPIFESIINLVASVYLATQYGVSGVLLGTVISTVSTSFWVEPLVLYKYGFYISSIEYFITYAYRMLTTLLIGVITWYVCNLLSGNSFLDFAYKLVVCLLLPNLLLIIIYHRTPNFKYLLRVVKNMLFKR